MTASLAVCKRPREDGCVEEGPKKRSDNAFLRAWAWKREHRPDKVRFHRPYSHVVHTGEGVRIPLTIHQARFEAQGFASTGAPEADLGCTCGVHAGVMHCGCFVRGCETVGLPRARTVGSGRVLGAHDLDGSTAGGPSPSSHHPRTVWDSSIVVSKMCEWQAARWRGKRCLDLSAGCGLVGITLRTLGAQVTATDLEPNLPLLRRNCQENGVCDGGRRMAVRCWARL